MPGFLASLSHDSHSLKAPRINNCPLHSWSIWALFVLLKSLNIERDSRNEETNVTFMKSNSQ